MIYPLYAGCAGFLGILISARWFRGARLGDGDINLVPEAHRYWSFLHWADVGAVDGKCPIPRATRASPLRLL